MQDSKKRKIVKDPVLGIPGGFRENDELAQLTDSSDVAKLRSLLEPGEIVFRLIVGFHEGSDGVLAATNRRILYADQKFVTSKVLEYTYEEIAAIVYATHLVTQEITLVYTSGSFTITSVAKDHGNRFIDLVGGIIGQNYDGNSDHARVFKQRGDMLDLEDLPSQQEDTQ